MVEHIQENVDPELAMREACGKHGTFKRNDDGTLHFEDYVVFRSIIVRQAARLFEPKKTELDKMKALAHES